MAQFTPAVGYHHFHDEVNMNFQLNRPLSFGGGKIDEIRSAANRIRGLSDWKREFLSLAETAERDGRRGDAAVYLRLAEFFMSVGDTDKQKVYEKFVDLFHKNLASEYSRGEIIRDKVRYESGYLPVMRLPVINGKKKGVLVAHGGFDSFIEELYPLMNYFREHGYEVIAFEGPGQGACLRNYGLVMTPEWERPVGAVLDHYGLSDVTLMGISLGGYLAPRAAAFDKRIKRVVAYDVIYDFFGCIASVRGPAFEAVIRILVALRAAPLINAVVRARMRRDPFVSWGVNQGMHVYGVRTPYRYFREVMRYNTRAFSRRVTQDFLLMAGTRDHFIPLEMFFKQARALTNVRSLTCRLFTEAESAQSHCQVGNIELALSCIVSWMDEIRNGKRERSSSSSE
ncbi:MAG: alpha/beta fold hydrolase [Deltaproteobacteria bacterium]|nr:alpha/beta fold hydrolase [Candidatus Zymogenaceae bacterium]